jgi:hypothetical protein
MPFSTLAKPLLDPFNMSRRVLGVRDEQIAGRHIRHKRDSDRRGQLFIVNCSSRFSVS